MECCKMQKSSYLLAKQFLTETILRIYNSSQRQFLTETIPHRDNSSQRKFLKEKVPHSRDNFLQRSFLVGTLTGKSFTGQFFAETETITRRTITRQKIVRQTISRRTIPRRTLASQPIAHGAIPRWTIICRQFLTETNLHQNFACRTTRQNLFLAEILFQ